MTRRNVAKAGSLFLSWATAKRDGGDRCVVTILRGEAEVSGRKEGEEVRGQGRRRGGKGDIGGGEGERGAGEERRGEKGRS